jgi:hypothetical protein
MMGRDPSAESGSVCLHMSSSVDIDGHGEQLVVH